MSTCTFVPRIQRQIVAGEHAGCGPKTDDWLLTWSSCGKVRPQTAAQIRARAGNPGDVPTDIHQLKAGFDGWAPEFTAAGLSVPKMRIRSANGKLFRPLDELREALAAGHAAGIFLDYGYVTHRRPKLSGDPKFTGIHILPLFGYRLRDGEERTTSFDPLYDGRRKEIPNGPRDVPLALYLDAMAAYAGVPGQGVFGIVERATAIPQPVPPPERTVLQSVYDAAIAERDTAQNALGEIAQLAADIDWPHLGSLAAAGLPPAIPGAAGVTVANGAAPPKEDA